jgi:hypothetical protein
VFETIAIYRAGTTDMEVFTRQPHGSVTPVSGQALAAFKKQNAAVDRFWEKAFDKNTSTDKALELMEETRRKIQSAEKEKSDAKK